MRKKRPLHDRIVILSILLLAGSALSACSGGARATTWTGLVISDGTVYVADLEQVRGVDTVTGETVWVFPPEPSGGYGPFYTVAQSRDGEALLVTSYERSGGGLFAQSRGVLRALGIESAQPLWEFAQAGGEFVAAGAVGSDTFVIGNSDGNVYAFNVEDGRPAWDQPFATGGRVWATPLIISDTVYVASLDHNLYALDLDTGGQRWERPFEADGAMAGQPLALGDTLYVGAFDRNLYALDKATGAELWRFQGANWFWGTPATNGVVIYAADVSGGVYALDAATGNEVWPSSVEVDQPVRLGPALSADGETLLVAGDGGTLYGLDADDGFELWRKPGDGQLASLAVSGDVVVVSRINADQRIQAIYTENGRDVWPAPEGEE